MRNWHLVVLCGLVSAAISAGTTLLLRGDRERAAAPAPETTSPLESTSMGPPEPSLKGAPPRIEAEVRDLKAAVARLQQGRSEGAAALQPTPAQADEVLSRLVSIQQGEQLLAIRDTMETLIRLGDAAVPGTVEYLRSGKDQSWGGGLSTNGNKITAYGRLRTVLIDALRQIGTPAAKKGLLDVARKSGSLEDYRDLLMMYGSTTDPEMVAGISALVPDILESILERGPTKAEEHAVFLVMSLARWIQSHRVAAAVPALAKVVEAGWAAEAWRVGDLAGVLVDLDPAEAFRIVEKVRDPNRRREAFQGFVFPVTFRNARRASIAAFYELAFSRMDLPRNDWIWLHSYSSIPASLCQTLATDDERVADARPLLALLETRLADETEKTAREVLVRARDALAGAIAAVPPPR